MKKQNNINTNCISGRYESIFEKITNKMAQKLIDDIRDTIIVILSLKVFNVSDFTILVVSTYLVLSWIYTIYKIIKEYMDFNNIDFQSQHKINND